MGMHDQSFRIFLEEEPEGGFHASAPQLPGVHTWGETREDAIQRVREAIELYLDDLAAEGEEPAVVEEAEVTVSA